MRHFCKGFLLGLILVAIWLILPSSPDDAEACGGFFCSNTPIDQNAERIIFTINGDDTITAIVGINYVGEAEDFSWIVPVPTVPVLDVAETNTINVLDFATSVRVNAPSYYCGTVMPSFYGFGGGGDGPVLDEGAVGPYDYVVLGSEDPDELITWLRDNNYRVTEDMEPLIDVYVQEGMNFLAMKLQTDAEVSDIQPIMMTYVAENPTIPLRLTAVAAVENMPVITWIFAEEQYVPVNFANPTVDFSQLQQPNDVLDTGRYRNYFFRATNAYPQIRNELLQSYDGHAFVTEFAQPTDGLVDNRLGDAHYSELVERFPYVTRLYAQLSPDQMTVDPTFMPDKTAADVSNFISLDDYVDPIRYYGCSTRTAIPEEHIPNLPNAHTRVDELQFDVAHPDDWELSTFFVPNNVVDSPDDLPVWVLAPEPVDFDAIEAYFAGEDTPPMFVFSEMFGWVDIDSRRDNAQLITLLERLGQDSERAVAGVRVAHIRYKSSADFDNYGGVVFGFLTTADDWQANDSLYDAMLAYAAGYQYYADADFQHTTFLTMYDQWIGYGSRLEVPYPGDWVEHMTTDWQIYFTPQEFDSNVALEDLPYLRLIPMQQFDRELDEINADNPEDWWSFFVVLEHGFKWMVSEYGFPNHPDWQAYIRVSQENCPDDNDPYAITFEQDGRIGQARLTHSFVVEISAPNDNYDQYEEVLLTMYADVLHQLEAVDSMTLQCREN